MKTLTLMGLLCLFSPAFGQLQTKVAPSTQVAWPDACTPGLVYSPSANTCVSATVGPALQYPPAISNAITNAGSDGSVVVPGSYTGTDTFQVNPNGVMIEDQRPLSNTSRAVPRIDAAMYGAVCNGATDDTAAIQAALNAANSYSLPVVSRHNNVVHLPQGSCLITAPLQTGVYGSLEGEGATTYLIGDYFAWTNNSDYTILEILANGPLPGGSTAVVRHFSNMQIVGVGSNNVPSATAVLVSNNGNVYNPSTYAIGQLSFDHVQVSNLDTGFNLQDTVNTQFHFVWANQVRVGWNLNGDAVQIFFDHVYGQVGSWAGTSNHQTSIGLYIGPNNKYGAGCAAHTQYCAPQGIFFGDSSIIGFDVDIQVDQCTQCNIHDNTIDVAAGGPLGVGAAIKINPFALGGGLWIKNNYIGTATTNTNLIYSTASSNGGGINGLWIEDNHFLADPGTAGSSTLGIALAGSVPLYGVHLNGNNFWNIGTGIAVAQSLLNSEIRGNTGDNMSTLLINLDAQGNNPDYTGTVIDSNTTTSAVSVVNKGTATNYNLGYNHSSTQITGSWVATGTGCTFTAGTAGQGCAVAMVIPVAMIDLNYEVTGCTVYGATTKNYISMVGPFTVSMQFPVTETATDAFSTGGGIIKCSVVHR